MSDDSSVYKVPLTRIVAINEHEGVDHFMRISEFNFCDRWGLYE